MYRREALINERKRELEWLDDLIDKSRSVELKPEIAREVEQITALAGALGLSFDPAGALNYRRARETGDLQQEIDTLKLQLQLDQLKRDAELIRSKFESQTDPLNADLGKLGAGTVAAASSGSASAADELKAAIEKLNTTLATRLDADGKLAQVPTNIGANPADVFRDRAAYRDLLKSARNAASLDELHDLQGHALIRLSFEVTAIPEAKRSAVPGVVQMRVAAPELTPIEKSRLYAGWLDYLNENLNRNVGGKWTPKRDLLSTAAAENFDIVEYRYAEVKTALVVDVPEQAPSQGLATLAEEPLPTLLGRPSHHRGLKHLVMADVSYGAPARPPAKLRIRPVQPRTAVQKEPARSPRAVAAPAAAQAAPTPVCPGLVLDRATAVDPNCGVLLLAAPRFRGLTPNEGAYSSLANYVAFFDFRRSEEDDRQRDIESLGLITPANVQALVSNCGLPRVLPVAAGANPSAVQRLAIELRRARVRGTAGEALANLTAAAERMLRGEDFMAPESAELALIRRRTDRARLFIATFETAAYAGCSEAAVMRFRESGPELYVPPGFERVLTDGGERVSIYEVGPREQTQQVSTVARAANSLALALSVAAAQPGSGSAANAAASYSRQAMGRAQSLERVPAVVGYASASADVFGWVLGPRATLDPKGRLDLEQTLRPYDLTVDLSVPGWWPRFTLQTATSWAPGAAAIASGNVGASTEESGVIQIEMSPNSSDFEALTARLARGDIRDRRRADIIDVRGDISACKASTILLKGQSLWRASAVLIGGRKIDGSAIDVLPDMSGVMVDVPALEPAILDVTTAASIPLTVLTPYGDALGTVGFIPKPADGCDAKKPAAPTDGPKVASVEPLVIRVPSTVTFQVRGDKLDAYDKVTLHGQRGKVTLGKDNKSLQVSFTAEQTSGVPQSRSIKLSFFKGDKSVDQTIEAIVAGEDN